MRDDICTIPITDVFKQTDGCPICRMRNTIENRITDYILGAAMMEPDVRIKTNELGFCSLHLSQMMQSNKRLPLALILETHLDSLKNDLFKKSLIKPSPKKIQYKTARIEQTCFVCDRVEWGMQRLIATTVKTYGEQRDFRDMFNKQEFLCLPHYGMLVNIAGEQLSKNTLSAFLKDCEKLTSVYLNSLYNDVHHFTKMFDYRNSGDENADWGNSKDSIERACCWLTSREKSNNS